MTNSVNESNLNMRNSEDVDVLLLSRKPSQLATRYTRILAFGNRFRVEDTMSTQMVSYNSGVASVFELPTENHYTDVSVTYVGVFQDILLLDYGALQTPVILLRCEWVKPYNNLGNPTYTRDDAGFLVVNFRYKLPRLAEPFIFPSQATQVFFSDVMEKPGWKVVSRKESRAKPKVVDTIDAFISTTVDSVGLRAPRQLSTGAQIMNLVGAIELSVEDNLLTQEAY